jgi:hypothetical protein
MLSKLVRANSALLPPATQAAVIAAMVLACWFLAPRASGTLVALLAGALLMVALVQHPQWGLVVIIPASLCVPLDLGTGTGTKVPITLLIIAALLGVWLLEMLQRREVRLAPSPANLPFVVLIAVAGLALVTGNALWSPFVQTKGNFLIVQLAQWAIYIFSAGAYWLTANLIDDTRWLKWMVGLLLGLGGLYMVLSLVDARDLRSTLFVTPWATGSLFWVWPVALAAGQVVFNRQLRARARLALVLLVGAIFYVAWFHQYDWVSGWAPPAVALMALLWLRSWRWGLVSTLTLALGVLASWSYFYDAVWRTAADTGSFLRLVAAEQTIALVGRHWLLGLGLAAYPFYWIDLVGYWTWAKRYVVQLTIDDRVNTHNNYLDIYAQMGVVGLAAFLWLVIAIWRQAWRAREAVGDGFERGYVYGCLAGLAGSLAAGLLADWFLPFVYNIQVDGMRASALAWLFLGGVVALEGIAARRELRSL